MKSPIFLFSLPRAGSTLIQRVMMSHKDVASVAEPWLMLPPLYALKKEGVLAEYDHQVGYSALKDFINNLPNDEDDYYAALETFFRVLYEKQCKNNEVYFLDKTPRYYLIIAEIVKVFPNAKFIFLFRNPAHVMSSMIQTWSNGHIEYSYKHKLDLKYAPKALSDGYTQFKDQSYAVRYEDYVNNTEHYTKEICEYLEIDYDEKMLSTFVDQDTKGRMGDPTGTKEYKSISLGSLEKWKNTFNTPVRKKILYNYIKSIEDEVLSIQGYDKKLLLKEIADLKISYKDLAKDITDLVYSIYMPMSRLFKKI